MLPEILHLSDRELLLWADGEVPARRAAAFERHLCSCWTCRARLAELERAIGDFVQIYRREFDVTLPPVAGPRALLKARLAEHIASTPAAAGHWFSPAWHMRITGALAVLLLSAAIAIGTLPHANSGADSRAIPNVHLTPGATNPIAIRDVCSARFPSNDPAVPDDLKREVLKEYGLNDVPANAYQIDYLVTPQLGGATNIRNLWPQPSLHTVWNARVKDALEDRLHQMVCSGGLDLPTAQREISSDWVAAYKKYFRTNAPLQANRAPGIFKM